MDIESVALDNRSSLFLDFDGTLVEFKDDPRDVYLNKRTLNSILSLSASLDGRLAVVSGRDIEDLELRVPQCVYRVGNHGAHALAPEEHRSFREMMEPALTGRISAKCIELGIAFEIKKTSMALHFRATPELAHEARDIAYNSGFDPSKYHVHNGNMVVELRTNSANKGIAIQELMNVANFVGSCPVYIGDDTTDEDAFDVINKINGISVKVGRPPSKATCFCRDVLTVQNWLANEAERLER